MTLQQIEFMTAVVEAGSVSLAAENIFVSRPTLSRALKELENEFGAPLFTRTNSGLALTDIGSFFYSKCLEIKALNDALHLQMETAKNSLSLSNTVLHCGIGPATSIVAFPVLCKLLEHNYLDLLISTQEFDNKLSQMALRNGTMDIHLAVCASSPHNSPSEFERIWLFETNLVFCIPINHRLADKNFLTIEDIKNEPLVFHSEYYQQLSPLERLFAENGYTPNIRFRSSTLATIGSMVKNGLGCSFLMKGLIGDETNILEKSFSPPMKYNVFIEWNSSIPHEPFFYNVIEFLKSIGSEVFDTRA